MKPIRRVLVVNPYGIGDVLFMTPVLRALKLLPGIECVDLLLGSRTDEIFEGNPHVDRRMGVDKDRFRRQGRFQTYREILKLGKTLRKARYDLLIDYSLRGEYAFSSLCFLGIRRRAGFHYKNRGFFHNLKLAVPDGFTGRHMIDFYCALAEIAGVPVIDRWPEFYLDDPMLERGTALVRDRAGKSWDRYLVLSPGGGESWGRDALLKQWPPARFAELAGKLAGYFRLDGIAVIGSSSERSAQQEILEKCGVPAIGLSGDITLREAAAVIDQAGLFLGNDGGLLHIAAARRKPIIGIYGPTDPEVYGPYPQDLTRIAIVREDLSCRPCYRKFRYRGDCDHRSCLQGLNSGEVWSMLEAKGFLNRMAETFRREAGVSR